MSCISPRISIVDGTHLCLLPSSGNVLNDSVLGGSSEKNQHQQTHVAIDDMHHINEESINIPAVPLSSICNVYNGGEYISFCSSGDDTAAGDIKINREKISTSSSSSNKNNLHELPIETIQIPTSDISNAEYRFIHSTSLINSTNNVPLRIVVSDDLDEANVSVNNKHVKVSLPSFTSSDELISPYGDECKVIYGGEHYNIIGGGDDIMVNSKQSSNKGQQSLEVQGAGSCLVADFLGIVGYEQALVLPQIKADLLSKSVGDYGDESIQQQKELLQMILRHSFLTDGMGILLPKSYANSTNLSTTKTDDSYSIVSLTMSPLERLEEDLVDAEESPDNDSSELLTPEEGDSSAHHSSNTTTDTQPADTCNDTEPQEDPEWLKLIAQTVDHRLSKQVEESNQIERSAQARIDLVNQGRRTLHAANRPMNHSTEGDDWNNDPEVLRLRYGMRPRMSNHGGDGISVVLDLELDILMPSGAEDTANSSSSATNTLHDFHISCSLTSNKNNNKNNQSTTTTTPENIRSSSGVVPTLQPGDCITMLASVCLEDIKISMNDDDNSTLDISIQGLWVDDASSSSNNNHPSTRRGAVLCILRLPIDSLFLAPPASSSFQHSGGQWIQHEIDFTSENINQHQYPEPDVIVDYRQPRTLTIDTSSEMNSTNNAKMWKDLVTNLNASIGASSSYIDLYCKKDSPRLKFVIFSSNPEERVGEWCVLFVVKAEFIQACYLSFIQHPQ